jgi:hypothetical protein
MLGELENFAIILSDRSGQHCFVLIRLESVDEIDHLGEERFEICSPGAWFLALGASQ